MNTYNTLTDKEADALVSFFNDCGFSASRKGLIVKVKGGDGAVLDHLYEKFVTIAII